MMSDLPVDEWTCDDVSEWLQDRNFHEYCHVFCEVHKINGKALLALTETDLRQPPLNICVLGHIKLLYMHIRQLQMENIDSMLRLSLPLDCTLSNPASKRYSSVSSTAVEANLCDAKTSEECLKYRKRRQDSTSSCNAGVQQQQQQQACPHEQMFNQLHAPPLARNLEAELWKTAISVGYFFMVTWITAIVMVIVHDRVPDMEKYPPLPDIFLDNVPHIPWAFYMCEVTACVLGSIWVSILVFHKHRSILLRRMFAIFGSVFLLRCITMLITSLSVPGRHLDCKPRIPSFFQPYGDLWAKMSQAFLIWRGAGMSIRGVRTCGDYMFSGHTVTLTMLNFFITEYTPRRLYYLHTFTWILNVFGVFFILAAHEHYSIDVFIAFYISTRLFLYYHTLANNRDLMQRDSKRTRIWFPLFSFFEGGVDGIVPNEFENPFSLRNFRRMLHVAKVAIACSASSFKTAAAAASKR